MEVECVAYPILDSLMPSFILLYVAKKHAAVIVENREAEEGQFFATLLNELPRVI